MKKYKAGYQKTREQFVSEASKLHHGKYDYTRVDYVNNYTEVCIVCPKHGEFLQKPITHLTGRKGNGSGCHPDCL